MACVYALIHSSVKLFLFDSAREPVNESTNRAHSENNNNQKMNSKNKMQTELVHRTNGTSGDEKKLTIKNISDYGQHAFLSFCSFARCNEIHLFAGSCMCVCARTFHARYSYCTGASGHDASSNCSRSDAGRLSAPASISTRLCLSDILMLRCLCSHRCTIACVVHKKISPPRRIVFVGEFGRCFFARASIALHSDPVHRRFSCV